MQIILFLLTKLLPCDKFGVLKGNNLISVFYLQTIDF